MDVEELSRLATKFEKQAQVVSAQPGDISTVLDNAGLFAPPDKKTLTALLTKAKVSDDTTGQIFIVVSKGPSVTYSCALEPKNPQVSNSLSAVLKSVYAATMANAIKAAQLNVTSVITVKWFTI